MRAMTFLTLAALLVSGCGDTAARESVTAEESAPSSAVTAPATTAVPASAPPAETTTSGGSADTSTTEGITEEEDRLIPPVAPLPPVIETTPEGVVIRWQGTGPDVAGYLIYERATPDGPWQEVAEAPPEGDNLGDYRFLLPEPPDPDREYAVVAVDTYGNQSEYSTAVGVDG